MIVQRGTHDKLKKYFDLNQSLKITLQIDDRYMIFYKQK